MLYGGGGGGQIITHKQVLQEGNVLFKRPQHILFTVIWRQTYGKEPLS